MTTPHDSDPQLDRADARLIAREKAHYAPRPMTAARRHAFDAALRARLEPGPRHRGVRVALFAAAAAGLAIAGLLRIGGTEAPGEGHPKSMTLTQPTSPASGWEYELFYPGELAISGEDDERGLLPEAYVAIASVFLDG